MIVVGADPMWPGDRGGLGPPEGCGSVAVSPLQQTQPLQLQ
jgi:hypothetical protein